MLAVLALGWIYLWQQPSDPRFVGWWTWSNPDQPDTEYYIVHQSNGLSFTYRRLPGTARPVFWLRKRWGVAGDTYWQRFEWPGWWDRTVDLTKEGWLQVTARLSGQPAPPTRGESKLVVVEPDRFVIGGWSKPQHEWNEVEFLRCERPDIAPGQ